MTSRTFGGSERCGALRRCSHLQTPACGAAWCCVVLPDTVGARVKTISSRSDPERRKRWEPLACVGRMQQVEFRR